MAKKQMSEEINRHRRRFFGTAAMTKTKPAQLTAIKRGAHTSFASLKQVDAGVLNVGYAEAGPADGPPVILLHGWPYDIHSFVEVAPLLPSCRTFAPMARPAFFQMK